MLSVAFNAIAAINAHVLILGSLPGTRSLERSEYYAHPGNSFWWIMGQLMGASPELAYKDRCSQLKKSGIALWDVCHLAERSGSADSNILLETVEPNDFESFCNLHPHIQLICFNGQPAEKIFRRTVSPLPANVASIPQQVLPSTSPAHASLSREQKLIRWRNCLAPYLDEPAPRTHVESNRTRRDKTL